MKQFIVRALPTKTYLYARWWDYKISRPKEFAEIQKLRTRETSEWGSYKPFDQKKSIFVHIPKCAGVSVNRSLFGNLAGGHTSIDQYINVYEPTKFLNYFKFTFVRNPWDRVVSAYTFLQKGGMNKWDEKFYEEELKKYKNFKDFVMNWLNEENIQKHHHFKPQIDFIVDKYQRVSVDYIAYLENMEEDYNYIAKKLNIETPLEQLNQVSRSDYRSFYDDESKNVVQEIYKDDIFLLNYEFSGVTQYTRKLNLKDL
ncbi:sulfotransferase family 2 domain-containing protein [Alteromonas sp. 1_MG-2023]|uniref:sulfotransferase family 2 domain-containing protein n=1 Tax=Alteromonas sp. 1_MG-2023 TaxID=3062669 RepID=UPI0026E4413B|nr:sulfotransferase family 2 domain-containing protein [Alteromonas sp. 1_MG-2023]MDO6566328.1 sulfotransferase family 2 domain-containing protein [Alteromonas sp. 1_MG-2023]